MTLSKEAKERIKELIYITEVWGRSTLRQSIQEHVHGTREKVAEEVIEFLKTGLE